MALFDDLRAAWGARKPQGPIYTVPIASRTEKFAHWNGGPLRIINAKSHAVCLAAVKAIQAEHMHDDPSHNWSDIGYNALICPAHARLIEGRGRDAVGAHCPNHNRSGIAVQFMLGQGETATPAMFARAARFFADCETAAGHTLRPMGHRDGYATECPGDQIEAWVKAGMPGTTTRPKEWDELATEEQITAIFQRELAKVAVPLRYQTVDAAGVSTSAAKGAPGARLARPLDEIHGNYIVRLIRGATDPAKLAASLGPAIAAQLPQASAPTQAQLEAALRTVLGSVDEEN